jgi:uracil-DNA glycosylase
MIDPLLPPPSLVSQTKVPNVFPTYDNPDYRLAIIGEAPGADEELTGVPFMGQSGRFLDSILGSVGIDRSSCFVGNVCKYRPPNNDITEFDNYIERTVKGVTKLIRLKGSYLQHEKVLEGMNELRHELNEYKPHCTLLLGQTALSFARGPGFPIDDWRGSILSTSIGKAVVSWHPTHYTEKNGFQYSDWPFARWDFARARAEAESPELNLPTRQFDLDLSATEICAKLDTWPTGLLASVDIEGGLDGSQLRFHRCVCTAFFN